MYQPRDGGSGWDTRRSEDATPGVSGSERRNFVTGQAKRTSWDKRTRPPHNLPARPITGTAGVAGPSSFSTRREGSPGAEERGGGRTPLEYRGRVSPEPGQIPSPGPPRSPRRRRSSTDARSGFRRDDDRRHRSRGGSPTREGSVAEALEAFSRTMHSILLLTSERALARTHFRRLQSFPSSSESTLLREAQDRLYDTERDFDDCMITLQDAFTEVIRRTVDVTGKTDLGGLELDGVKDRLKKLERSSTTRAPSPPKDPAPPPPPSSPPAPPPETAAAPHLIRNDGDVEMFDEQAKAEPVRERKSRLKEVLSRLEAVEALKEDMETRCDDLENLIWQQSEEFTPPSMTWGRLESVRSAPKRIRLVGEKRKREDQSGEIWDELEKARDPEGKLRGIDDGSEGGGKEEGASPSAEQQRLESRVAALQAELKEMKETSEEREKQALRGALSNMKGEVALIIRQELNRLSASWKKPSPAPPTASVDQNTAPNPQSQATVQNGTKSQNLQQASNPQLASNLPAASYSPEASNPPPASNPLPIPNAAQQMVQAAAQAVIAGIKPVSNQNTSIPSSSARPPVQIPPQQQHQGPLPQTAVSQVVSPNVLQNRQSLLQPGQSGPITANGQQFFYSPNNPNHAVPAVNRVISPPAPNSLADFVNALPPKISPRNLHLPLPPNPIPMINQGQGGTGLQPIPAFQPYVPSANGIYGHTGPYANQSQPQIPPGSGGPGFVLTNWNANNPGQQGQQGQYGEGQQGQQ